MRLLEVRPDRASLPSVNVVVRPLWKMDEAMTIRENVAVAAVIQKYREKYIKADNKPILNSIKITDAHRAIVTRYYGSLLRRYGLQALLRHIPALKRVVWTSSGIALVESRQQ